MTMIGSMLKRWAEPELRRTSRLLKQSNDQLDVALRENTLLKEEKARLRKELNDVHADYREMTARFNELHKAYDNLGNIVATIREDLEREKQKSDERYRQLMKLQAQTGDL